MKEQNGFGDVFDEKNVPASNWFKFENVGDKVAGELVTLTHQQGNGTLPDQRVFGLKTESGEIINVGIAMTKDYIIQRTNQVKVGDIVGFEYKASIPAKVKGYAPAKSIEVYVVKGVEKAKSIDDITGNDGK